jgi:hypothetical protein
VHWREAATHTKNFAVNAARLKYARHLGTMAKGFAVGGPAGAARAGTMALVGQAARQLGTSVGIALRPKQFD